MVNITDLAGKTDEEMQQNIDVDAQKIGGGKSGFDTGEDIYMLAGNLEKA